MARSRRFRFAVWCSTGLLLVASGCAWNQSGAAAPAAADQGPTGAGVGSLFSRMWSPDPPAPREPVVEIPEKLQNPERLHLAYARWQEDVGNLAEARKSYETVLGEDAANIDAMIGLARLDQAAGLLQQAEQGFQKAVRSRPNEPRALGALGQFYASQDRWAEAVSVLKAAVAAAPHEPVYQHRLATALARSGDLSGALALFSRAIGEAEAHYNIGYILYEQGKSAEAERHFRQALQKRPDLEPARTMVARLRPDTAGTRTAAVRPTSAPTSDGTPAIQPKLHAVQPVAGSQPTPGSPASVQEQFLVPAQFQVEQQPPAPEQWSPTQKGRASGKPQAAAPMTPQQREQWANQSRPAAN